MTNHPASSSSPADDMAEYLQTFLDETEEQLDDLVETMLALERDPINIDGLNEAFRLIHSIKGSAGMMGFDNITVLTHHLENRFERFRAGRNRLDEPTMNLVLRSIDFLRQCNDRLRDGEQLGSSAELLSELRRLEETEASDAEAPEPLTGERQVPEPDTTSSPAVGSVGEKEHNEQEAGDASTRIRVRFRTGLPLVDLKAQLILARLGGLGEVIATQPDREQLADVETLDEFEIRIDTHEDVDRLRAAADVDGVESIEFAGASAESTTGAEAAEATGQDLMTDEPTAQTDETTAVSEASVAETTSAATDDSPPGDDLAEPTSPAATQAEVESATQIATPSPESTHAEPARPGKTTVQTAETMRVDIGRLDNLMNLAGELVVNRARLVQIAGQISPALRKASTLSQIRDFSDGLRRTIEALENAGTNGGELSAPIQQLRGGLALLAEQSEIWENGRHCLSEMSEAIDQLSRVSYSLQRGVLGTRMVPVGPLFNRFKRVVRDLSKERGKQVRLVIRGEKTELDKRMIDELGDPLVHLVRNSIDHGLEPTEARVRHGKPEAGTIVLEASHSGNNIYIHVRDDGGGIDVAKIKAKLVDNRVLSDSAVEGLSDEQALDYIWYPGFSTAAEVTDVSGRGVGMDVVKTRINQLNGTIEVDSTPQQGTSFTLRLPLTLAIIDCLLVRLRDVVISMPIDDVREIVSVNEGDVVTVHGKQTFDVRGEFIPLVRIEDVFQWRDTDDGYSRAQDNLQTAAAGGAVDVVILQAAGRTMGLRVDELLGSQDMVIKSLSDNFISIRGLSGASILGDGSVCLMLDVGTVIDMATAPRGPVEMGEVST